jgi:hypothetical protein
MLGPNHQHVSMANQMHQERLSHAARIQKVARERRDTHQPFDRDVARRLTVARLAATAGAVALTFALAASAAATNPVISGGGGGFLIR